MNNNMSKNQAELEIEALANVFNLATDGFESFYKEAKSKTDADSRTAASSGDHNTAASSGYRSTAASSGDYSTAASSGDYSTAASSGEYSACSAIGNRAAVKGELGNLIMASEYTIKENRYIPIGGKADIVDGKKLKAGYWYIVENSEWVHVDFTDGIFSYVLSDKTGVRKVRTPEGDILFIVTDADGNSAHGETIAKAREDLVYKIVAKFDGKLPKSATGKEWVGLYRAITGACGAGTKQFIIRNNIDLDKNFTCNEIAKLVEGQFGEDAFKKACKNE